MEKGRSYPINLLDEMRANYRTAEFVFKDQSIVRVNLTSLKSMEELLDSLKIKSDLMRYFPLDRKPYLEVNCLPEMKLEKIYINKID